MSKFSGGHYVSQSFEVFCEGDIALSVRQRERASPRGFQLSQWLNIPYFYSESSEYEIPLQVGEVTSLGFESAPLWQMQSCSFEQEPPPAPCKAL